MLVTPWKDIQVTADNTNVLLNDQLLGDKGPGIYDVIAVAAAAADATITLSDGNSDVLSLASIPVRAAAVTFPEIRMSDDVPWRVLYTGNASTLPINIVDGTNAEIIVRARFVRPATQAELSRR